MINYKDIKCIHKSKLAYIDANNLELVATRELNTVIPLSTYGSTSSKRFVISLFTQSGEYICSAVRIEPWSIDNRTDSPLYAIFRNGKRMTNCVNNWFSKSDSSTFTPSEFSTYIGGGTEVLKCFVYKSNDYIGELIKTRYKQKYNCRYFSDDNTNGLVKVLRGTNNYDKYLWNKKLTNSISKYSVIIGKLMNHLKNIDNDSLVYDILKINELYVDLLRSIQRNNNYAYLEISYRNEHAPEEIIYKTDDFYIVRTYYNKRTISTEANFIKELNNTMKAVEKYNECYKLTF